MIKTPNIKGLEQLFEKNLTDEYLQKAISKIVSYEISKSTDELKELRAELDVYEKKFSMPSSEFFNKFNTGKLGDGVDYFEWSSLYKMYLRVFERLSILKEND